MWSLCGMCPSFSKCERFKLPVTVAGSPSPNTNRLTNANHFRDNIILLSPAKKPITLFMLFITFSNFPPDFAVVLSYFLEILDIFHSTYFLGKETSIPLRICPLKVREFTLVFQKISLQRQLNSRRVLLEKGPPQTLRMFTGIKKVPICSYQQTLSVNVWRVIYIVKIH